MAMTMQADVLEERWTPTTIQSTFTFHDLPPCTTKSRGISIPLSLPSLGWTFALSLAPQPVGGDESARKKMKQICKWSPAAFLFRQHGRKIPWGNTSMHAQLSLDTKRYDCGPHDDIGSASLGTIQAVLADTPSAELPLATSYRLSSSRPTKVWLTVTISECPFSNGLFQARSHHGSDAEVQTQLVRQSGDRVLHRSLTTGKHFDVQFLSCSTRSTHGNFGELLPTYASLSVLEKHVNFPDGGLKDGWASALAALNDHDNADSKFVKEISSPDDEYELLDSDYEDEDENSSSAELGAHPPCERDLVITLEAKPLETRAEGSWSPVELDGASDQDSVNNDHHKGRGGRPGATANRERTVLVKFAAHRTWHAFLWYCYTGHVEFNRLKSQADPGIQRLPLTYLMDEPPSCSPKSMYRLAYLVSMLVGRTPKNLKYSKVGNDDLKAKALEAIKERMDKANILDETFSIFTSKFSGVREAQLGILMKHIGSPEVKEAFLEKIKKFGDMPHAKPVLLALCDRLAA